MTRLMIYDRTCGLSLAWRAGSVLYRGARWLDAVRGVSSWDEALEYLATARGDERIDEIQFWGHGKWGYALVGNDVLDRGALASGHPLWPRLEAVRERLAPGALWWFRTCETFGAERGHDFARAFANALGCDVAGHTYVIGAWQSGLHALSAGCAPAWSTAEGLLEGTPAEPARAAWSLPGEPRTIHCLVPRLPAFAYDVA